MEFLRNMPLTPGVPKMLVRLKDLGCDIIIISDANTAFISEPLKAAGVDHLIKAIFTNPASFDDDGRLNLQPYSHQVLKREHSLFFNFTNLIFRQNATFVVRTCVRGVLFRNSSVIAA